MGAGREIIANLLTIFLVAGCHAQQAVNDSHFTLEKKIPLPGVKGRIDHMDADAAKGVLYMAALGNNTLEVVSLTSGRVLHEIKGLDEPQGVAFIPAHDEICVANGGTGQVEFFNANTYTKVASIALSSDADDVRYDADHDRIYAGYGTGGLAIIDAGRHQLLGTISLPVHPEGFQLDASLHRIYVNLPDAHAIAVIDPDKKEPLEQWKATGGANFPMAVDSAGHTLIVGYRHSPSFAVIDEQTGKEIAKQKAVGDMDDLYFDANTRQVIISGGGGAIEVFRQEAGRYDLAAHVPVHEGARTSLLIPSLRLFVVAERATEGNEADLLVYKLSGR